MTTIEITALPQKSDVRISTILKKINQALALELDCPVDVLRSVWKTIQPEHYLVGEKGAEKQDDSHPPLVRISTCQTRPQLAIDGALKKVSEIISSELALAGNVFITYSELQSGKVFHDGEVQYFKKSQPAE